MATETPAAENKAVVERFLEGLDAHDPTVMDELLADDYTTGIYRSGSAETIGDGREGTKELWQEYWEAFPDLEGVSTELIAEGDRVAVFRKEVGTHEGEFRGVPPTGNEITFEYGGYVVVEDGRITHGHFRGDMLNLLKQMGVDPPIPR
jgi:predicted ester cyclase